MPDLHTCTCIDCGAEKSIFSRGCPGGWKYILSAKGYYDLYCSKCLINHKRTQGSAMLDLLFTNALAPVASNAKALAGEEQHE